MELLHPASFASAVASSQDRLRNVSAIIEKYLGQDRAAGFLEACRELDFAAANNILDDLVEELTGYDSVYIALSAFADKFPQLFPELGNKVSEAFSEADKVKAIESYREQILTIMKDGEAEP
ncbi:MAG: hypothetical protein IKI68_05290 [Clostridia bacterium]|nr:hypothetical protein [Clostridia bacterium]